MGWFRNTVFLTCVLTLALLQNDFSLAEVSESDHHRLKPKTIHQNNNENWLIAENAKTPAATIAEQKKPSLSQQIDVLEKTILELLKAAGEKVEDEKEGARITAIVSSLNKIVPTSEEKMIQKVSELSNALESYDARDNKIDTALAVLALKIEGLFNGVGSSDVDVLAAYVKAKAEKLTELVDGQKANQLMLAQEDFLDSLLPLMESIPATTRYYRPTETLTKLDAALKLVINEDTASDIKYSPPARDLEFAAASSALGAIDFFDNQLAETTFINFGNKINVLFPVGGTGPKIAENKATREFNQKRIGSSLEAMKVRNSLLATLSAIETPLDSRIHIISAVAGDLHHSARKSRQCNATNALRELCSRNKSCGSTSSSRITIQNLCGFNPVPQAPSEEVKLHVHYVCVSGNDHTWTMLSVDPRYDPEKNDVLFNSDHPSFQSDTLRIGSNWAIRCGPKPASAQ